MTLNLNLKKGSVSGCGTGRDVSAVKFDTTVVGCCFLSSINVVVVDRYYNNFNNFNN
jgi:hypothetical protein